MAGSTKRPVEKLARVEKHVTLVVRSVKTQGMENETRKAICRHAGASIMGILVHTSDHKLIYRVFEAHCHG